jgi:DNA repair protein RecO (recombination protein O)
MQRLGMAVNCIKFLEAAHTGAGQAEQVFDLILNALHVLNATPEVPATFPLVFRAKLACVYGYEPVLDVCGNCGAILNNLHMGSFSWAGGWALCPRCRNQVNGSTLIHDLDLVRLRQMLQGSPEDWIHSAQPQSGDTSLWQVLDHFVQFHTGLQWEKGRFRRV